MKDEYAATSYADNDPEMSRLRRYTWILVILWSSTVCLSLLLNLFQQRRETLDMAQTQANIAFQKDVFYRLWNTMHGGVYAPVSNDTLPNSFLNAAERDIQTPSGRQLTLINPAFMTRQIHELQAKKSGVLGHITSLNPLRPQNAADPWESEALLSFEQGEGEQITIIDIKGVSYFRFMRPLVTEKGCLKCHAGQGYKEGDIRGGISVSVPMAPLWSIGQKHLKTIILGHGVFWVLGLCGMSVGKNRISKRITERRQAEKAVKKSNERMEEIFFSLPTGNVICNTETQKIVEANPKALSMIGAPIDKVIGSNCEHFIHLAEGEKISFSNIEQTIENSESMLHTANGKKVPILLSVIPVTIENQNILILSFIDISEQKCLEQERIRKEKLQGVLEMSGAVCHELNQPMQAISGYSELLSMDISEDNPLYGNIKKVKGQIDRMGEITRKLMRITKYETKDYMGGSSKIIDLDKSSREKGQYDDRQKDIGC